MPLREVEDFSLDDYLGITIDSKNGKKYVSGMEATSMSDPRYGNMASYPESLVMGDALFPMIYVYYMGENKNKARVGDENLMKQGLREYFSSILALRGSQPSKVDDAKNPGKADSEEVTKFEGNVKKYYKMLISAIDKNSTYLWQLNNAVKSLMAQYRVRLPKNRGNYYKNESGTKFDYFPILDTLGAGSLTNCMEALRLLYENGVIAANYSLGIRPLNLYDGAFADELTQFTELKDTVKVLGLPVHGMFTVNNRPRTDYMFRTFSGIDIIALASLNTVVSRLEGMTSLSWSLHRGSTPNRTIGKPVAAARARGGRTIAGSMIFALADHHPLLELLPGDYPITTNANLEKDPDLWRPMLLADQIPPFDLMVTMTNEYGHASIVSLYGIEIQDEGTVIGVDNLVTELVVQYTAVSMDPIMRANRDESGAIDPYGLLQGGYSRLYKHREMVVEGVAYSDLQDAYEAQYDSTFAALERRLKQAHSNMVRTAQAEIQNKSGYKPDEEDENESIGGR